jgi:putative hemolysin
MSETGAPPPVIETRVAERSDGRPTAAESSLYVERAASPQAVREAQRLRWQVFAEEKGARLSSPEHGYDIDPYDDYCIHILVRDRIRGIVVACARILYDDVARGHQGFYSESEFDLEPILRAPGRTMEMGRTCVHPEYRKTVTIGMLWTGVAQFTDFRNFDRIIGCASVPLDGEDGPAEAWAAYDYLARRCACPPEFWVRTRKPLPRVASPVVEPRIPPLLMAYIRYGALLCSEPYWDEDFGTADLLMMLPAENVGPRYLRRYVGTAP